MKTNYGLSKTKCSMAFQGIINREGVDWAKIRQKYPVGIKLECKVVVHLPFGIFLDKRTSSAIASITF